MAAQPAPPGLGSEAQALWDEIITSYELDPAEISLLRQIVRNLDDLCDLQDIVGAQGLLADGKPTAAVVELRQQRITYARLLNGLRIASEVDEEGGDQRVPRRPKRGFYAVRDESA